MSMTTDEEDQGVIVTPNSDSYHKSHPSALLHLACNPTIRGELKCLRNITDREPCNHPSCFGGDDD